MLHLGEIVDTWQTQNYCSCCLPGGVSHPWLFAVIVQTDLRWAVFVSLAFSWWTCYSCLQWRFFQCLQNLFCFCFFPQSPLKGQHWLIALPSLQMFSTTEPFLQSFLTFFYCQDSAHFTLCSSDNHFKIVKERNKKWVSLLGLNCITWLRLGPHRVMDPCHTAWVLTLELLWGHGHLLHGACWILMFVDNHQSSRSRVSDCRMEQREGQSINFTFILWRSRK